MTQNEILCIDDESDILDALERLFRRKYKVHKTTSPKSGLQILQQNNISVIICDQRMPDMQGVDFFKASLKIKPECIRILLTGYTDIDSVIEAINSGEVYKYISKPWDPVDLKNTVDKASEKYFLKKELKEKNIKLQKALNELKSLDANKTQFMYLINHELKTPLTVISSYLQILEEEDLSEDQKKYLKKISSGVDKLDDIVKRVLLLIQSENQQLKIKKTNSFDLKSYLDNYFKDVKKQLSKNKIKLETKIDPEFKLKTDSEHFGHILNEALNNAVQFCLPEGKIQIKAKDNKIEIKNSSKTITKEILEQIDKPFQLNESSMNHSKGLGLGLSLIKSLCLSLGYKLEVESKNDTFIIKIMI